MFEGGFDQQRPTFLMSTRHFTKSGLFRLILIGLVRGLILAHLVVFLQIHKSFQHPRFNLRSWHTCLSFRIFYRNVCRSYRSVGVLICSLPWQTVWLCSSTFHRPSSHKTHSNFWIPVSTWPRRKHDTLSPHHQTSRDNSAPSKISDRSTWTLPWKCQSWSHKYSF